MVPSELVIARSFVPPAPAAPEATATNLPFPYTTLLQTLFGDDRAVHVLVPVVFDIAWFVLELFPTAANTPPPYATPQ